MNKVLICGLGAVGLTFAVKFRGKCDLKILVDEERLRRYQQNKPVLNGRVQEFEYVLPSNTFTADSFSPPGIFTPPDLIIIATKAQGLESAIKNIKNFVGKETIILSLLNGISSEEEIKAVYPEAKVLKSYFIGHSAVRVGNSVTQDGVGEIVTENNPKLIKILEECGINYSCPVDIDYSMWLKFTMNIFSNQTSAVLNMTFGELKRNNTFIEFAKKLINEVRIIADKKGIKNLENLETDALEALSLMCDEGKTSMHQDILAGRKTEVDIFAGEIIKLGKKFGIPTPYNQVLYDLIKVKEEDNEHRIHTG